MRCAACGMQLEGEDFRNYPTLGDCHPVCPDCHRTRGVMISEGRRTLLRGMYAAGRTISRCQVCGAESGGLEVHFIRPLVSGGDTGSRNLLLLCPACHGRAHRPGARLTGRKAVETG
ncbi:MAG: HNH endonuclease signature motif containing protein [Gemmatimonadota bacterium]|nr:HNH endonuclease signature motif containing protein [Gemmatimonadota bacterium]